MSDEHMARVGKSCAGAPAVQQFGVQTLLERGDAVGERRLRHAQAGGGAAEAAALGDRQQIQQLPVVGFHSRILWQVPVWIFDINGWPAVNRAQCKGVGGIRVTALPDKIHLVGSIGLDTAQEVFRTVGTAFGNRLKRVPDGEPGPRRLWVSFQYPLLRSSPFLRPDPSGAVRKTNGFPLLCLADGVAPSEVRFGELGYAREAQDLLSGLLRGAGEGRCGEDRAIPGVSANAYGRDLRVLHGAGYRDHRGGLRGRVSP